MATDVRLVLLGKPRLVVAGVPVENFVYSKTLALLAFLAATGRAHSRDALAGLLWGEMPDEYARANLRKVLSDLRRSLASHLIISRQTVALDRENGFGLDVEAFESELENLKPVSQHHLLSESEIRWLRAATDLYGGDFMEGFYVHDAPAFEEWVLLQRERLQALQLSALYVLTKHYTARGAYAEGINQAARLLALAPWHEDFHRQMMLLLALSGQRSAALYQYETCRRILKKELDIEPAPDTVALYKQIQDGDVSLPPLRAVPPHNLLAQVTPFVGRGDELAAIRERLNDPQCRLLTLVGISGAGKTRLALQAASELLAGFPDGVYLVTLGSEDDLGSQVRCVAASLGLGLREGQDAREQLLAYLRDRQMLLLLDGAEHLCGRAEFLAEMLQHARNLKLLLTSLARLTLPGEWVLPVGGLALPATADGRDIEGHAACQLFLTCARRGQPDFAVSSNNQAHIQRICQLVEGLPLAIELAASWVHVLTCEEIVHEIERNIDFLATSSMSVPERHRSLRAVFARCWAQLAAEEREVFSSLSVFRGGFRREAAEQVAGASLQILAALVDRCLVQKDSRGRYSIHQFLREYSAQKLAEDPERHRAIARRYQEFYSDFVVQRLAQLPGAGQPQVLDEMVAEMDNLQAASIWAHEAAGMAAGGPGLVSVAGARPRHSLSGEGDRLFDRAIREVYALIRDRDGVGPLAAADVTAAVRLPS